MAIGDRLYKKMTGKAILWPFTQLRSGIIGGAIVYRRAVTAEEIAEGERQLERSLDLPQKLRATINAYIVKYGKQAVVDAIVTETDVTIAELKAELTTLEAYTQGLVDRRVGGESWDDICTDIEAYIVERESDRWDFRPPARTDVWGTSQ